MLLWLKANLATVLIALILVAILAAVIFKMIKDKKEGRSSCGCGCSACAMRDSCHPKK